LFKNHQNSLFIFKQALFSRQVNTSSVTFPLLNKSFLTYLKTIQVKNNSNFEANYYQQVVFDSNMYYNQ